MRFLAVVALLSCAAALPAGAQSARQPSPPAVRTLTPGDGAGTLPVIVRERAPDGGSPAARPAPPSPPAIREIPVAVRERAPEPPAAHAEGTTGPGTPPGQFIDMLAHERELGCVDTHCLPKQWRDALAPLRDRPKRDQVVAVHRLINAMPYGEDRDNYGQEEYWATPLEFFYKGSGDCDDYVSAKHEALRWLGWPAERLIVVVVETPRGPHAVLAVNTDEGTLVLDNNAAEIRTLRHPDYLRAQVVSTESRGWWDNAVLTGK